MPINEKVVKIRKIKELKSYFDDLITGEENMIAEARQEYQMNLYFKPSFLMKKIFALCYRDTFRTCNKRIEFWKKQYVRSKNNLLTEV